MAGGYQHVPRDIEALVKRFRTLEAEMGSMRRAISGLGIEIDGATGDLVFNGTRGRLLVQGAGGAAISGGGDLTIADGGDLTIQDGGNLVVDGDAHIGGNVTLDGTLTASGGDLKSGNYAPGSAGWRLRHTGNLEVNDITLRGGIIGDDALANPLRPIAGGDSGSGYSLPKTTGPDGGGPVRASIALTVPSGFTQVLVQAIVNDAAVNSTASPDYLNAYVSAGTEFAWSSSATVPSGSTGTATASATKVLTGLAGGQVVRCLSRPFSYYGAWAANGVNSTVLEVLAFFIR